MKKLLFFLPLLLLPFLLSGNVWAQRGDDTKGPCDTLSGFNTGLDCLDKSVGEGTGSGLLGETSATAVLKTVINWLLGIVAALGLLALVVGGIMYVISFGDEKKTSTAKNIIFYAIIGIVVVGVSFSIIAILETFLTGAE